MTRDMSSKRRIRPPHAHLPYCLLVAVCGAVLADVHWRLLNQHEDLIELICDEISLWLSANFNVPGLRIAWSAPFRYLAPFAIMYMGLLCILAMVTSRCSHRRWEFTLGGVYGLAYSIEITVNLTLDSSGTPSVGFVACMLFVPCAVGAGCALLAALLRDALIGPAIAQTGSLCPRCGYCVQSLPVARCPECGNRFNALDLKPRARWRMRLWATAAVTAGAISLSMEFMYYSADPFLELLRRRLAP